MAVGLVIGRMGTGKTLTLMGKFVVPALRAGRVVVHNIAGFPPEGTEIPLLVTALAENRIMSYGGLYACDMPDVKLAASGEMVFTRPKIQMPGSFLERMGHVFPRGALIVIDEYYIAMANTMLTADDKAAFYAFLRAHRHYVSKDGKFGCDVIVAAQHDTDLPPQLREIVEWTMHCRRDRLWKKKLERVLFDGFCRVSSGKAENAASVVTYKPDPKICAMYSSYDGSAPDDDDAGKAVSYFGRFRGHLLLLAACMVGLVVLWGPLVRGWFGDGGQSPYNFLPPELSSPGNSPAALPIGSTACFFAGGFSDGYILRGDCSIYPDDSPLISERLEKALNVDYRIVAPAPEIPAPALEIENRPRGTLTAGEGSAESQY